MQALKNIARVTAILLTLSLHVFAQQIVDGASSPDLIPDTTAYGLLFRVLNAGSDETPKEHQERVAAYIEAFIGLDDHESELLIKTARRHSGRFEEIAIQQRMNPESKSRYVTLREQSTLELVTELKNLLGPESFQKLYKHLDYVKKNTKMRLQK